MFVMICVFSLGKTKKISEMMYTLNVCMFFFAELNWLYNLKNNLNEHDDTIRKKVPF